MPSEKAPQGGSGVDSVALEELLANTPTEATEHTTWGSLRELLFIDRELKGYHVKEKQAVSMWL